MPELKSKYASFRQKVNIVIYGTSTKAGRLFDLILLGIILLSVLLIMLETVAEFDQKYHHYLLFLEWIITGLFTIEYILRIISINKPWRYITSFYGIIDLLAILPMYLSIFVMGTSILAVIRSLRLLRLFKILNHPQFTSQSLQLKQAIEASKGKIVVFIYFVLISTIIIGSIMYVVEGKENGFTSIPAAIYWTIVTLTTVGYGDISPQTPLGQFIASFVMILGYGIIAVPTGIVTAEIAKRVNHQSSSNHNPCNECGAEDYPDNANFCHHCGHSLEKK
ncbi:ion transporter [Flavobacterium granuli]|uniref:Voltage-gated potassium channel n=1 Tax=Flavobacterium granuli TaxID=280093 RepID=A0A1M5R6D2_9FLAO|nr:ion transporter [Flavobacterium granuli]PRZ21626.1 voltage-gated potassium channel [Flavobacterium granuli]SHH21788.1 voltage-gated potassium channel [Flavobacterium granuli]